MVKSKLEEDWLEKIRVFLRFLRQAVIFPNDQNRGSGNTGSGFLSQDVPTLPTLCVLSSLLLMTFKNLVHELLNPWSF